jgi:hypothetical protein
MALVAVWSEKSKWASMPAVGILMGRQRRLGFNRVDLVKLAAWLGERAG